MRSISEHFAYVHSLFGDTLPTEEIPLSSAAGRVLASPAVATIAVPPFSNSAMDGFAIRKSDIPADASTGTGPWSFPISGDIAAGSAPEQPPVGYAQRIMTGAPVPEDSDLLIIPVEVTNIDIGPQDLPERIQVSKFTPEADHIRRAGSNIRPGDTLGQPSTELDAGTIAALLSTGVVTVEVYRRLRVGVITTGNEVVDTATADGGALQEGQIPDSNGPMVALLAGQGLPSVDVQNYRVQDTAANFRALLDELSETVDVVLTTGGVSAGAFDVVREVADHSDANTDMWFGPINMKPGKPQGAGLWRGTPLLCMPGNPVSAWASFHMFIAPLLRKMRGLGSMGDVFSRPVISAQIRGDFPTGGGRTMIVPVQIDYSQARPEVRAFSGGHFGSHFVGSLVGLGGFVVLSDANPAPRDGDSIDVVLV